MRNKARNETVVEVVVDEEEAGALVIINIAEDPGAAAEPIKIRKNQHIDLPFQDKIQSELARFKKPYRELSFNS